MLKLFKNLLPVLLFFTACESVYDPEVELVGNVLVVDARLVYGQQENKIILQYSAGFNKEDRFDPVTTARVIISDRWGMEYNTVQHEPGVYTLQGQLDSTRQYKLIISAEGEIYESELEAIPPVPAIDTLYSDHAELWARPGGENSSNEFIKTPGQQLYVDIYNDTGKAYFKFTAQNILQYYFTFDTILYGQSTRLNKYGWKSFYPQELFNIAGPAVYSSKVDVKKHPVEFFLYNDKSLLQVNEFGLGWIYIMHQYSISESAYNFYSDVNSQLNANGKIFDPLYVQARNNIKCVSDPNKIILGNFEIANHREYRFFVHLNQNTGDHIIRPIEEFYEIPPSGIKSVMIPWFWEN